jgi:hypothetical protein
MKTIPKEKILVAKTHERNLYSLKTNNKEEVGLWSITKA